MGKTNRSASKRVCWAEEFEKVPIWGSDQSCVLHRRLAI